MNRIGRAAVAACVTVGAAAGAVAPAGVVSAAEPKSPVTVIARGLEAPFGLQFTGHRTLVVAENGTGEITKVDTRNGRQRTLLSKLPGPAGVGVQGDSMYVALAGPSDGPPTTPSPRYPAASVVKARATGAAPRVLADLLRYETRHNPDGQVQLVDGRPVDALANPFSVNVSGYGLLVADGGANAVLRVGRLTGRTSTFFVPPNIRTPECLQPGRQANPGAVGCDSVPTGVAVARGSIYVATLGSEVRGAARIYRLDPRNGRVLQTWTGLTGLTGIAVAPNGTIYASQALAGAPEGPPGPDFDPAAVGQIVKIEPNGRRTHSQVTMPTGLAYHDGSLYASAWSVAGFMGMQKAGQIVRVHASSFR